MQTDSTDFGEAPGRRAPWWLFACSAELSSRDVANYRRYHLLLFTWAVFYVGTVWTLKHWADALGPASYALALLPPVFFVVSAAAYVRFLRQADELTRKIHVEGMAIGFGVGLTCMLGYPLLEMAGAPHLHLSDESLIPTLAGYVLGLFWAQRRYR